MSLSDDVGRPRPPSSSLKYPPRTPLIPSKVFDLSYKITSKPTISEQSVRYFVQNHLRWLHINLDNEACSSLSASADSGIFMLDQHFADQMV
jgi:hypothetical protein